MEQIEEYRLRWAYQVPTNVTNNKQVILQQGTSLKFLGRPDVHPFWGPFLNIDSVFDANKHVYKLPKEQWFFSSKFEDVCKQFFKTDYVQWYHYFNRGFAFSKNKFVRNRGGKYWHVSLAFAIGTEIDANIVGRMLKLIKCTSSDYRVYVAYSWGHPTLYVNDNLYSKLPTYWTMMNLLDINKDYYSSMKTQHELLWYNIAEARRTKQSVKINAYDPESQVPVVYTEKLVYGIALPDVLPQDEGRSR